MTQAIQLNLFSTTHLNENPAYLESQLITYIGNKRALLPFIGKGLELVKRQTGKSKLRFADLFSGTGVVARYAKQHSDYVVANDLETYSRITNDCYLTNSSDVKIKEVMELSRWLSNEIVGTWREGFLTELYAPRDEANITCDDRVFYTKRNAMFLDSARRAIDELPKDMQKFFLAPLLAKASVHANTSGVFKGFYKSSEGVGQYGGNAKNALTRILGSIDIPVPIFSNFETSVHIYQEDVNLLVEKLEDVDIVYLDPPYNQHPYGSNYFMLNLICSYERPKTFSKVSGIPVDWNRSRYNQRKEAEDALFEVIEKCRAEYVMLSYNSEGFISHKRFVERLNSLGTVTVLETPYNTFRGSRNLRERAIHVTEFLYLLRK